MSLCVVFVCDKAYFNKFTETCNQLVTNGNYKGNICLVIGDDLVDNKLLNSDVIVKNNVIIKHFPNIKFNNEFIEIQKNMNRPRHWFKKIFQFHKLHLFNTFFKQWEYIFYLDSGINIYSDISPILTEVQENTLLAHSDAYPGYEWKLINQFSTNNTDYFKKLTDKYNLNIDYFQSTIMLYHTKIIEDNTFDEILNLLLEYPISITNDQGILSLYFTCVRPLFKQIKTHNEDTYFYDYLSRNNSYKYIMLKSA